MRGAKAQNSPNLLKQVKPSDEAIRLWSEKLETAHPEVQQVVTKLEWAGDYPMECPVLFRKLYRVNRARTEDWQAISRADLARIIRRVRQVLRDLETLRKSEVRRLVLPGTEEPDFAQFRSAILTLLRKLNDVGSGWDKRNTPRTDEAVADVMNYIHAATGKPHDREVAVLLRATLGRPMNLKVWRQRHSNLLKARNPE